MTVNSFVDDGAVAYVAGTPPAASSAGALDSPARSIHVWRDNAATRHMLVGTDHQVYVEDASGALVDMTPSGFVPPGTAIVSGGYGGGNYGSDNYGATSTSPSPIASTFGFWSWGQWGQDVIFTANTDGHLYYFTNGGTTNTLIAAAPTGAAGVLVTPERHVMMVGATGNPRQVSWSSSENQNDWNFASTTNTAGNLTLAARSPLLGGWVVKEGTLVLSRTEAFLIRYVGLPYVYGGVDPIADLSLFNPSSVITFDGKAAWLGRTGFQLYDAGSVKMLDCPILSDILGSGANVDPTKAMDARWGPFRLHGGHNIAFPELTWFYPSTERTECDRYVTYNYVDDAWSWGALDRTAMSSADAQPYPYMGDASGHLYRHEIGMTANGASRVGQVFIETGVLPFGKGDTTSDISGALIATDTGLNSVSMSIMGRYAPEGTEYTDGPFYIRDDGYLDCRTSYRDNRIRFDMTKDANFSIGVIRLDVTPGTGR